MINTGKVDGTCLVVILLLLSREIIHETLPTQVEQPHLGFSIRPPPFSWRFKDN
jgi:hypothetical protein